MQIEEIVLYGFAFGFLILNFFFFPHSISTNKTSHLMFDYLFGGSQIYLIFFLFLYIFFIIQASFFITKKSGSGGKITRRDILHFFGVIASSLRFMIPIALFSITFFSFLESASILLRFSGNDLNFFSWDQKLFHLTPMFFLGEHLQGWWPTIVWLGYMSLSWVFGIFFIIGFYFSRSNYYKKILLSFILVVVLATPFWLTFPCQDPFSYFVLKRHAPVVPSSIQAQVLRMAPAAQSEGSIISNSEVLADHDHTVPISCFPSMHAGWTYIIVFFAFLFSPWTLFVTVPWMVILLLGGLYFGQHYAVDYLMAIPVTILAVCISYYLVDREKKREPGK